MRLESLIFFALSILSVVGCDDNPAPVYGQDPLATCGSRWKWLVSTRGMSESTAKCQVQNEEPSRCACLPCENGWLWAPRERRCTGECSVSAVPENRRQNCGWDDISQSECRSQGCCFAEYSTTFRCYYAKGCAPHNPPKVCTAKLHRRNPCKGSLQGNSEDTCRRRGCCFDKSVRDRLITPQCFEAEDPDDNVQLICDVLAVDQENCGWEGVKRDECQRMGCCWNWGAGGHECYYGQGLGPRFEGSSSRKRSCDIFPAENRAPCIEGRAGKGLEEKECRKRGCCYDLSTYRTGIPLCYSQHYSQLLKKSNPLILRSPSSENDAPTAVESGGQKHLETFVIILGSIAAVFIFAGVFFGCKRMKQLSRNGAYSLFHDPLVAPAEMEGMDEPRYTLRT